MPTRVVLFHSGCSRFPSPEVRPLHSAREFCVKDRRQNQILSEIPNSTLPQVENPRRIHMKNLFLLIAVPALLVATGFGQTPASSSNTDQSSVKGCLAGSDGNYTLAEDGTTRTFNISSTT